MNQSVGGSSDGSRSAAPSRGVEASAQRFNQGMRRAESPTFACNDQWQQLVQLVWLEYAFCTMYGVNIVDGNIVSCENVQRSLTFGPGEARSEPRPTFDDYWRALQTMCLGIGTGRLSELRFNLGHPVGARTDEGGRRFKRLIRKSAAGLSGDTSS